ncbi:MAG: DUF4339 domain-containing protein [Treponema sp.]|nr:DUF4339 domain-containing protein [Treponema sp.]
MDGSNSSLIDIERALNTLQEYKSVLPLISKTGPDGHAELIVKILALEKDNAAFSAQNKLFVTMLNARQTEAEKHALALEAEARAEQAKNRQNTQYKISIYHKESGPYSIAQLKQKIYDGDLTEDYYVRPNWGSIWKRITEVLELKETFARNSETVDSNKTYMEIDRALNTLNEYKNILPLLSKTGPDEQPGLIARIQALEKDNAVISEENKRYVEILNSRSIAAEKRAAELEELLQTEQSKNRKLEEKAQALEKKDEKAKEDKASFKVKQLFIDAQLSLMQNQLKTANENLASTKKQIVSADERLSSANVQMKALINKYIVTINNIYVGNCKQNNDWINQPGNKLKASEMRFLKPRAFIQSPLTEKQDIEFFVKIFNPKNNIWGLNDVPAGFSFTETVLIGSNSTMIDFKGIGDDTKSLCGAGTWRIEIWLGGVCIGTTTVKIQ